MRRWEINILLFATLSMVEDVVQEISLALGQSESTSRNARLFRARQSVKAEMSSVLEDGLRGLASRASVTAAVLAILELSGEARATTAVSTTASQAATSAAAEVSNQCSRSTTR